MPEIGRTDEHFDAESVAAYLDGRVTRAVARQMQEHMDECDECRADVLDSSEALDHIGRRSRRWLVPTVAAAAAAGLLLIVGPSIWNSSDTPVMRGSDPAEIADSPVRLGVVAPREGEQVSPVGLRLTWRSIAENATYSVTLTDVGGDPLWRSDTRDTSLVVPSSVILTPGREYLWYVDALRSDGTSATSGVRRLEVSSSPRQP